MGQGLSEGLNILENQNERIAEPFLDSTVSAGLRKPGLLVQE